jgi:hypothetical protein
VKRQRSRGENTIGGKNANEQKMVGVGGLEPPTSRTRTVRATKLRHTPTLSTIIIATMWRGCQRLGGVDVAGISC